MSDAVCPLCGQRLEPVDAAHPCPVSDADWEGRREQLHELRDERQDRENRAEQER